MYKFYRTPNFERDVKRCLKKHRDMNEFKAAVVAVLNSDTTPIPLSFNDHALKGSLQGKRELHIGGRKSDWLIIYSRENEVVGFERTGTHDELYR
ncbi:MULTISPECIES: type II toxin-antitoxin system RelE/ParE family toxin [Gordonibacter]|uniref:Type II toxin-antitoxin system YafQ family toxin n=1 Tax=Gordonibacter faecis TaxID=3047475 RepID=A0ABT7DJ93_9ACTN|nr:type II toxin-antitoxin system YafQ family toxin [Gordonibacter sp. KGMB12511]MDJ1649594.1 type II toxin-antitoxin system YafQ family toxin [Gordonibacter sp. KGMB12511]HIW77258.1 type II toxin-antitoxin system YafQ family toxin [Candidatus Gordonibacter avicola]